MSPSYEPIDYSLSIDKSNISGVLDEFGSVSASSTSASLDITNNESLSQLSGIAVKKKKKATMNHFNKLCVAPPGKLGIIIDTGTDGAVVYHVKDGSPLQGMVSIGDRIIEIDDIDTSNMSATKVSILLGEKAKSYRRLTFSGGKMKK